MKRIHIAAIAALALVAISCGSKKEQPVDAPQIPVEDVIAETDSMSNAMVDAMFTALSTADDNEVEAHIESINTEIATLAADGNEEQALNYVERLRQWYEANKEKVQNSESMQNLVAKTQEIAQRYHLDELKEKAKAKAAALKEEAKGKVEDFKAEHGDEIKEKVDEAKEKVEDFKTEHSEEIDRAKSKASELKAKAKSKAKSKAKEAAKSKVNEVVKSLQE